MDDKQIIENLNRQLRSMGVEPRPGGPNHIVTQYHDGSYAIFSMDHGDPLHLKRIHTPKSIDYLDRVECAAIAGAIWPWREP